MCDLLSAHNIDYFRGDELDVMSRFIEVSKNLKAKTIVRVTGDNPLTDPEIMDEMIIKHLETKCEYTYTDDLPHGTRPEIIQTSLLNKCHNMLIEKNTEYMTQVLNRPDKFKVNKFIVSNPSLNRNDISLTVDIMKDLRLIRRIYDFYKGVPPKLSEIINFYDQIPKELKRNDKDTFITSTDVNLNLNLTYNIILYLIYFAEKDF